MSVETALSISAIQLGLENCPGNEDNHALMATVGIYSSSGKPLGLGSKLMASVFFLFFLAMGSVFVWLVAREAVAGLRTWTWTRTECEITRSGVRETDQRGRKTGNFYPEVQYNYSISGRLLTSDHYTLKPTPFSDYGKAERLVERYPASAHAVCYVNPADPNQAVLERGSLVFPFLVFFPLIFVAIGAIGIYSAWRAASVRPDVVRPISDRASGTLTQRVPVFFFAIFMLLGLVFCFIFSIRPLSQILRARQWTAVPCVVLSSEVKSHSGNHGSTYSVNILYRYVYNDHEHKANRYDFMGGSSSGYNGKQAIVSRFPPGSQAMCYVDPTAPSQAVLERGFTPMMWIGLLPLIFFFLGLAGMTSALRKQGKQTSLVGTRDQGSSFQFPARAYGSQIGSGDTTATLTLQPSASPRAKFFGAVVVALFWNGIVSVFVVHLFKTWRSGYFEWFIALFLSPFILIGLVLLVVIGYFFLALFNPRPRLMVTPGSPHLGDSLRVEWEVSGRVESLQNLRVRLEGREEATYSRGTRTATDQNVFAQLDIATITTPQEMRSGTGNVTVPATLMHSFASRHNKIIWSIRIDGEIPRWPDLKEEFALIVLPATRNAAEEL